MSGVYRIICQENNMFYIGSTTQKFERRWQQHRSDMTRGPLKGWSFSTTPKEV